MSAIPQFQPRPAFYKLITAGLAIFVIVAFSRTYYLRFLTALPPLTWLMFFHGLVFTIWVLLFAAQARLIAAHRVDLHRKLGIFSAIFALLVVGVGIATVFPSALGDRVRPWGLTPPQNSILGFTSLTLFSTFIALGVAFRKRASLHKRFMVMAMIGALTPAASRFCTLLGLREQAPWLIPIILASAVAWCLIADWRRYRLVHPVYAVGGTLVVASWPIRILIGRSEWYQPVAEWVLSVGTRMNMY